LFLLVYIACLANIESGKITLQWVDSLSKDGWEGTVTNQGHILVHNREQLIHWLPEGQLLRIIKKEGFQIRSFLFDHEHYWLSGQLNDESYSLFFRGDEEIASLEGLNIPYFNTIGRDLFIPYKLSNSKVFFDAFYENNHLHCITPVQWTVRGRDVQIEPLKRDFYKITPAMLSLELNYKKLWLARWNDTLAVVNQIEPVVRIYSEKQIQTDREFGEKTYQPAPPQIPLNLPGFKHAPKVFWSPKKTALKEEVMEDYQNWQNSFGLITYFSSLGQSYFIAYTVPQTNNTVRHVFLVLNRDFKSSADPQVYDGVILGIHNLNLYTLTVGSGFATVEQTPLYRELSLNQ